MTWIPAKMPSLAKKLFPNYVWDFFSESNAHKKVLYLTFDDGPQKDITEFVINELKKYNAKATFFCIGNNIEKHPDIFKKIIDHGHAIGNHTHTHLEGWKTKDQQYISNIIQAQKIIDVHIQNQSALNTSLFRPPYGRIKNSQGKELRMLGYKIIMWDVVAKDWMTSISKEQCLKNIIKNTTNGSIIVMHDSKKASKNVTYALPKVLAYFSKKGFQFKAITI